MSTDSLPVMSQSNLRWTYAGTLDDVLLRYPWPNVKVTRRNLDLQLFYSVATGTPLLINDGYLVLNPACQDALGDRRSPIRVILQAGYLKILSRTPTNSLETMVLEGAKHGISSYANLVDSPSWVQIRESLARTDQDLEGKDCFAGWPRIDLTGSYRVLMEKLSKLDHKKRGLIGVNRDVFQRVYDLFENELCKDASKPRTKWEDLVMQKVASARARDSLMQMANEVYHHNFGIGLSARPPRELENTQIAVQSRTSEPFSNLYESYSPRDLDSPDRVPRIILPKGVDYSDGNLIHPFLDFGDSLCKRRHAYLRSRAEWQNGACGIDEFENATADYQNAIDEYLTRYVPHPTIAAHVLSGSVSVATIWLGLAGVGATLPVVASLGVIAFCAADFVFPSLMERYNVDAKISEFYKQLKTRPARWQDAVVSAGVVTSLTVDRKEAATAVQGLPSFS
jgi:hypothetical protein